MEKKIVVTKRFRNNTLRVYQYLLKEFSAKIAYRFPDQLEQRIDLIVKHPTIGKPSLKKKNIRSIILNPHNQLFYRYTNNSIEILCIFDMRKDPVKKPY
jgi:plasmid stabilization system protein ParE